MSRLRAGRRKYYDLFSHCYDTFVRLHARRDEDDTRHFLVDAVARKDTSPRRILDICCGTGSVIIAFGKRYPDAVLVGYDFSHGMLRKAQEKSADSQAVYVEGDAAQLPFPAGSFDVVACSHALYELKEDAREKALHEMSRVMHPDGLVLLMEHEVPSPPIIRLFFYMRLFTMGSGDAREFLQGGPDRLQEIFSRISVNHSPSGKSKLMICQK
jgi:ubiquinone/menaquinone biosynthesis C-methylase UbiE